MELTEKRFLAVPPQLLTSDADQYGRISISDTAPFSVKQIVTIQATGKPTLLLEVKRVESETQMLLGPKSTGIDQRTNLTGYTIAAGAFIFADEQARPAIAIQDIQRAVYAEEPAVAIRTLSVDEYGTPISDTNPLPIDGTISVQMDGPTNPVILNIPTPTLTEYILTLPMATKRFHLKMRGTSGIKMGWTPGSTISNYLSISPGSVMSEDNLQLSAALFLYIRPTKAGDTIELLYWT